MKHPTIVKRAEPCYATGMGPRSLTIKKEQKWRVKRRYNRGNKSKLSLIEVNTSIFMLNRSQ